MGSVYNEHYIMWYLALSGVLFALGGTTNKAWRRYALPLLTTGYIISTGVDPYIAIGAGAVQAGVLTLGYGDSHPWWEKGIVALSYSAPSLVVGLTIWQAIMPIAFLTMFYCSKHLFQQDFLWKVVESFTGFIMAATVIGALNRVW